jgi:hypothetical protein
MRRKKEVPSLRRGLILHEITKHRLEVLRDKTEADSDSDVVRRALMYYEELVADVHSGKKLIFRDPDEHEFDVPLTRGEDDSAKKEGPLVKRNLVLHERSARRLDALRENTNAASDSQLVREALRVYDLLVENAADGKRLILRDLDTGHEREYLIPGIRGRALLPRSFKIHDRLRLG